jgi:hypothetical protein
VTIYNEAGIAIWLGWIEEIALDVQRLRLSWSTQHLLSRVIARYPALSPVLNLIQNWQYSDWVQHAGRLQSLGAKESLISLQNADASSALQAAVNHLNQKGADFKQGVLLLENTRPARLEIHARGWWQRLDWTLDGEERGVLAHLDGGKSQKSFGLSGSERLAQSFLTGSEAFQVGHINLRVAMSGNASDDLQINICADQAGIPGTVLATSLLPNASLHGGWSWQLWTIDPPLRLPAQTRFWLVVERSGAINSSQYFALETDDGRGYLEGESKVWNGSSWIPLNQDLRFCLLELTETTVLMREVAARSVQAGVLAGVQIWKESGLYMQHWRALEKTRQAALEGWLALGCKDDAELSALVNPQRVLEVFGLPRMDAISLCLGGDGRLRLSSGVGLPAPLDLLGRHIQLPQADSEEAIILRGLRWTREDGLLPEGLGGS